MASGGRDPCKGYGKAQTGTKEIGSHVKHGLTLSARCFAAAADTAGGTSAQQGIGMSVPSMAHGDLKNTVRLLVIIFCVATLFFSVVATGKCVEAVHSYSVFVRGCVDRPDCHQSRDSSSPTVFIKTFMPPLLIRRGFEWN